MMGAGGVGGYFGGRMAISGSDVTFIARGRHLEAIRAQGLKIDSRDLGDALINPANVTDDPADVGIVDYVIVGVKLWDTEAAGGLRIQYGGSVKPVSAPDLMRLQDVDGLLVGGASLDPDEFARIVAYRLVG